MYAQIVVANKTFSNIAYNNKQKGIGYMQSTLGEGSLLKDFMEEMKDDALRTEAKKIQEQIKQDKMKDGIEEVSVDSWGSDSE